MSCLNILLTYCNDSSRKRQKCIVFDFIRFYPHLSVAKEKPLTGFVCDFCEIGSWWDFTVYRLPFTVHHSLFTGSTGNTVDLRPGNRGSPGRRSRHRQSPG